MIKVATTADRNSHHLPSIIGLIASNFQLISDRKTIADRN